MEKNAIGLDKLELIYENKNLVDNYDFTEDNFGHTTYTMGRVARRISQSYNDL